MTVLESDVTNDLVRVRLGGSGSGTLTVNAIRDGGLSFQLFQGWMGLGDHQMTFQADSLPAGDYNYVQAEWQTAAGQAGVDFTVRGRWLQTKYATIYEHTCSNDNFTYGYLLNNPSACTYQSAIFRRAFRRRPGKTAAASVSFSGPCNSPGVAVSQE